MFEKLNTSEMLFKISRTVYGKLGEFVLGAVERAQDCFGDDPIEDQELRSNLWNQGENYEQLR